MSGKRSFWLLLLVAILGFLTYQGVQAAVDLTAFTATPQENSILIAWETATEIDNAGFFVTRNTAPHPPYEDISGFVPAKGSGVIGAEYEFLDEDVAKEVTYYYVLEMIDTNQNVEYTSPISATISDQPTNTPTATATPTNTPTRTNTPVKSYTPTATRTRTPYPANTDTPAPPTFTPTPFTDTPTVTPTPTITPSPTLFDPPEIVLTLPTTETPIPVIIITATFQPTPTATPEPESFFGRLVESGALLTTGAICLVVLVWAALAVGVFIYLQKRNA
jgi:hypothetical protein